MKLDAVIADFDRRCLLTPSAGVGPKGLNGLPASAASPPGSDAVMLMFGPDSVRCAPSLPWSPSESVPESEDDLGRMAITVANAERLYPKSV